VGKGYWIQLITVILTMLTDLQAHGPILFRDGDQTKKQLQCYITSTEVAYLDAPVPEQASQRQLGSCVLAGWELFVQIPLRHGVSVS